MKNQFYAKFSFGFFTFYRGIINVKLMNIWAAARKKKQNDLCAQQRLGAVAALAQSDQSSLCALRIAKDPRLLHADSKDSDQTRQMP